MASLSETLSFPVTLPSPSNWMSQRKCAYNFMQNNFVKMEFLLAEKILWNWDGEEDPDTVKMINKVWYKVSCKNADAKWKIFLFQGNSVYYLSEQPDALHADRNPYNFEPASTNYVTNFEERVSHQQSPSIMKASNDDFVIQEQVYQMCPDCPVFSIPIPIPKSTNKPKMVWK